MIFGANFFKIFNLVMVMLRLFGKVFGDTEDQVAIEESEKRSKSDDQNEMV